jgi:methylase of polypeptide subunit release factors
MRTVLNVHGVAIELESAPGVFMPSQNGLFYAESVTVRAGERVLDIGTGSGVLAIMAAKLGATVDATDVDPRAVAAAQRNARLNGVDVRVHLGALAAGLDARVDVILANLPNEIVAPAHLARLSAEDARVFAGGERGNELILALLGAAGRLMHRRSRLYLPVHSLTDYHATLAVALRDYRARLLSLAPLPAKPFVAEHLEFYRALDERGVVHIFTDGERWYSYGYVYELRLPRPPGGEESDDD